MNENISIKVTNFQAIFELSKKIPEFEAPYDLDVYERRLQDKFYLGLIAYWNNEAAGFKLGYEKPEGFYSWMGGVLPNYRRKGIAKALAQFQEEHLFEQGFKKVFLKTRNQHKNMLIFALKNGFNISGVEFKENILDNFKTIQKKLRAVL